MLNCSLVDDFCSMRDLLGSFLDVHRHILHTQAPGSGCADAVFLVTLSHLNNYVLEFVALTAKDYSSYDRAN